MLERFRAMPMWALVPVVFLVAGALWLVLEALVEPRHDSFRTHIAGAGIYAAITTAMVSIRTGRARRQIGGRQQMQTMRSAVRSGVLPSSADPTVWEPTLHRWRQQYRQTRWVVPIMAVVFTATSLGLGSTGSPDWFVLPALFIIFAVASFSTTQRALRNLDPLLAELNQRTNPVHTRSTAPAPGAHWPGPGTGAGGTPS